MFLLLTVFFKEIRGNGLFAVCISLERCVTSVTASVGRLMVILITRLYIGIISLAWCSLPVVQCAGRSVTCKKIEVYLRSTEGLQPGGGGRLRGHAPRIIRRKWENPTAAEIFCLSLGCQLKGQDYRDRFAHHYRGNLCWRRVGPGHLAVLFIITLLHMHKFSLYDTIKTAFRTRTAKIH